MLFPAAAKMILYEKVNISDRRTRQIYRSRTEKGKALEGDYPGPYHALTERLVVVAAHPPSANLEQASKKTKTLRLGDAIEVLSEKSGVKPVRCYIDLKNFTDIAFERLRYLHVVCCQL